MGKGDNKGRAKKAAAKKQTDNKPTSQPKPVKTADAEEWEVSDNLTARLEGSILTLTTDLSKIKEREMDEKKGELKKTHRICTSHGSKKIGDDGVYMNVNVYKYPPRD